MEEIKLYVIFPEFPVMVKPAVKSRNWMPVNANKCLPLQMANQYGYEISFYEDISVHWNGGSNKNDITCFPTKYDLVTEAGQGIFAFPTNLIVRTPPGVNTCIQGPVNVYREGLQYLSAIVETDWQSTQLNMNFNIINPGTTIHFKKGEPFCVFYPVPRKYEQTFSLSIEPLANNSEEFDLFQSQWLLLTDDKSVRDGKYRRGQRFDGSKCPINDHQTRIMHPPIKEK